MALEAAPVDTFMRPLPTPGYEMVLPGKIRIAKPKFSHASFHRECHRIAVVVDFEMLTGINAESIHGRECFAHGTARDNCENICSYGWNKTIEQLDIQSAPQAYAIGHGQLTVLRPNLRTANFHIEYARGILHVGSGNRKLTGYGSRIPYSYGRV